MNSLSKKNDSFLEKLKNADRSLLVVIVSVAILELAAWVFVVIKILNK